ncbi:MAG: S-layer homology domain-containing protein [Clostridiales bacterium]|nr:S-layer homology domain-containing protein [Clostridiales bacterium]
MKRDRKKRRGFIAGAALALCLALIAPPAPVFARDGVGGFDGAGISAGEVAGRTTLDYQEYTFVTGEPVLLKGTLTITKSESNGQITSVFSYKLNNAAKGFQLTRDFSFNTVSTPKDGGQTVTETTLARDPSEKLVTDGDTYTLRTLDFTRSSLADAKPAVGYYSGNTWYRKRYEVGGGTATTSSGTFVTVESTGEFYGFDQYWGSADVENSEYIIEYIENPQDAGPERESWSGTANVRRSQSTVTELRYVANEPTAISFRGGFLETRKNDNVLEFTARMPEFAADGIATDRLKRYSDTAQISTFPSTKRLVSPDLRQIRGHWAEEAVSKLFGLEVLTGRASEFLPDQYITRAEFAVGLVAAAKTVPDDPYLRATSRGASPRSASRKAAEPAPSFTDVPASHAYFAQIEEAFARGLLFPADKNEFEPNGAITVADAAVAFIRALGLESLATAHGAITEYADDTGIPDYARDALYVSQKIGLLRGDERGNINPTRTLTKADAAVMLDRFVEYMRTDLKADYRDRLMDY